ncbi:MAG: hypothetical protein ACXQTD_05300 [Candidatus Syntropharchaeia archaeon]
MKDVLLTIVGVILGIFLGMGILMFLLHLLSATITEIPKILGSGAGLIVLIAIAAFIIIEMRIIVSLITGVIIGIVLDLILGAYGIDIPGIISSLL